jgi:hypothetical protein
LTANIGHDIFPEMSVVSRRQLLSVTAGGVVGHIATARGSQVAAEPAPAAKLAENPYADGILTPGEPPPPVAGAFTFVVLPDTQFYAERFPALYTAQTEWIVAQREARRIAGVFHLGDITNRNTPEQWKNAQMAMRVLETARLPYCMVPGNHDYGPGGNAADRTTLLNDFFPITDRRGGPGWGGTYDKEPDRLENNFQFMEAGGRKFLAVGLEFGPRADVVRWANEVIGDHPDHEVVLLTHAYVYFDDTRYDWAARGTRQQWNPHTYGMAKASNGDVHDGEQLWRELVSKHRNVIMTFNGHVLGDGLGRVTTAAAGREISQQLVNFQMRPNGGDGWLRLVEMRPDGTAHTWDYSPVLGSRNESPQNQFAFRLAKVG